MKRRITIALTVLICAAAVAAEPPTLNAPFTDAPVKIDGRLDDQAWTGAALATDFSQFRPVDDVKPEVATRVLVTYDNDNLYFGFFCETDPSEIRKTLTDRDRIYQDDFVGVMLDTYGDAVWAYEFYVNPLGVQGDIRWVLAGDEDTRFDLVYHSAASVTDSGWQAEMAIPFSSLRFPDGEEQVWRINFWRNHPREVVHKFSWAPIKIGSPCFFCEFGYLTGVKGVHAGSKIDLLPAVVGTQAGSLSDPGDLQSPFDNLNPDMAAELNGRFRVGDGLTIEATVNPDFSQVESDEAQIDVNSNFALFFPERRPFFQEGGDLYGTYIDAIYTRAINDPSAAIKLTGRSGRASYFFLNATDNHSPLLIPLEEQSAFVPLEKSYSNIGRIRRSVGRDSHIGALFTDRRIDLGGGANTVYGADGSVRFLDKYQFQFQVLGSHTNEPIRPALSADFLPDTTFDNGNHTVALDGESYDGVALFARIRRTDPFWGFNLSYSGIGPTFRADNGFLFRNNDQTIEFYGNLDIRPNGRLVARIYPEIDIARIYNFDGTRKDEWIAPGVDLELTGQTNVGMQVLFSRERYHTVWFDDIRRATFEIENGAIQSLRLGASVNYGNSIARNEEPLPVMGRQTQTNLWAVVKPLQQLTIEPEYTYYKLLNRDTKERIAEGYIVRTRLNYQFTRRLFTRLIVQYDDFEEGLSVEPLLTYKVNPFTIFYIGSTSYYGWDNTYDISGKLVNRQFFLKLQYLFRV